MEEKVLIRLTGGVNQSGVRDHNERLILSVLQRHGPVDCQYAARRAQHTHLLEKQDETAALGIEALHFPARE